jgi:hypothetical protein
VFIDPAGQVTPIHEGTFAYRDTSATARPNPYTLGRLSTDSDLLAMLDDGPGLPDIGFEYLAPLELILALELLRRKADRESGIGDQHSPYGAVGAAGVR